MTMKKCHICKAVRPEKKISVFTTDITKEYFSDFEEGQNYGAEVLQHVRYCNDKDDCKEKAKTHNLIKI